MKSLLPALFLLSACAPPSALLPPSAPSFTVNLAAENYELRAAARRLLQNNGVAVSPAAKNTLRLRETAGESPESFAADGSIGSVRINYQLFYSYSTAGGEKKERAISRAEVVNNDIRNYWASQRQRRRAAASLRIDALAQMLYTLETETQ